MSSVYFKLSDRQTTGDSVESLSGQREVQEAGSRVGSTYFGGVLSEKEQRLGLSFTPQPYHLLCVGFSNLLDPCVTCLWHKNNNGSHLLSYGELEITKATDMAQGEPP